MKKKMNYNVWGARRTNAKAEVRPIAGEPWRRRVGRVSASENNQNKNASENGSGGQEWE